MTDRITIFDTTLRDGEKAPGITFGKETKVAIARQLARLGVDVVEAGFPMISPGEFEAVEAVAAALGDEGAPVVAALARAYPADIRRAGEALRPAARPRINIFVPTSAPQQRSNGMTAAEAVRRAPEAVEEARRLVGDVQFSLGDAYRADPGHLAEIVDAVVRAGAATVTLVDSSGYAIPSEVAEFAARLRERVPGLAGVTLGAHHHNDLGLAAANALGGVMAGARQVECTVNGLGERAGNTALAEFAVLLRARQDLLGLHTGLETSELLPTSSLVAGLTGYPIARDRPVVGHNTLVETRGTAVPRDPATYAYEVLDGEASGGLGKHTTLAGLRAALTDSGRPVTSVLLRDAFRRLKELTDAGAVSVELDELLEGVTS
jgi:2-isopropylmalate synthase